MSINTRTPSIHMCFNCFELPKSVETPDSIFETTEVDIMTIDESYEVEMNAEAIEMKAEAIEMNASEMNASEIEIKTTEIEISRFRKRKNTEIERYSVESRANTNRFKTVSCFNCLADISTTELIQIRAEDKYDLVCLQCRNICWSCQSKLSDVDFLNENNSLGGIRQCSRCHAERASLLI